MTSAIFYKFKSQREESRITFDGTGLSVFDLKKEIILANDLGKANDFDLFVYDSASEQEYKDDATIIPRSTSVIVKRLPAARAGKGKAAMYIAATNPTDSSRDRSTNAPSWKAAGTMSKRFDGKEEPPKFRQQPMPVIKSSVTQDDEAASIAAMFQASTEHWEETQEKMSQATKIYSQPRHTTGPRKSYVPQAHQPEMDRPTPPGYICYRCGQKGHWIQQCPTNNDREYDNRPRIKRTTGIPRSMLKVVEQPKEGGALAQGVMVTPDGGYVVAQPDIASWEKQRAKPKVLTEAEIREKQPTDSSLACPLCSKIFREAVKTPCCGTTYCEECIQTHLLERDFICPGCDSKIPSLDKLVADRDMRTRVKEYIEQAIEESKKVEEEKPAETPVASTSTPDQTAATNGDQSNDEFSFDQQPGNDNNNMMMPVPTDLIPDISAMQAQLSQLTLMLNNPNVPQQKRATVQMQAQQLSRDIQQANMMIALSNSMTNGVAGAMGAPMMGGMGPAGFNGMGSGIPGGMGMGMPGMPGVGGPGPSGMMQMQMQQMGGGGAMPYNQRGYRKGEYRPGWTNPFPNQQPAGQDSAYQRLPVNPRRRGPKRDRPSDFLEVGRDAKMPRYWE